MMQNVKAKYTYPVARHHMRTRDETLLALAANKNVIHVGCVDHPEIISEKLSSGRYLHANLVEATNLCHGYDVNQKGLDFMRSQGFENLYSNIEQIEADYDVALIPDVIEHIQNCGKFLEGLKKISAREFVFSTPNAFKLENRFRLLSEFVNDDHRYWFSPYTIKNMLQHGGFSVTEIYLCDVVRKRYPIRTFIKNRFPLTRGVIVVKAKLM